MYCIEVIFVYISPHPISAQPRQGPYWNSNTKRKSLDLDSLMCQSQEQRPHAFFLLKYKGFASCFIELAFDWDIQGTICIIKS